MTVSGCNAFATLPSAHRFGCTDSDNRTLEAVVQSGHVERSCLHKIHQAFKREMPSGKGEDASVSDYPIRTPKVSKSGKHDNPNALCGANYGTRTSILRVDRITISNDLRYFAFCALLPVSFYLHSWTNNPGRQELISKVLLACDWLVMIGWSVSRVRPVMAGRMSD